WRVYSPPAAGAFRKTPPAGLAEQSMARAVGSVDSHAGDSHSGRGGVQASSPRAAARGLVSRYPGGMRIPGIPMSAQPDVEANLALIRKYIAACAQIGADLVVFPEAAMLPFDAGRLDTVVQPLDGPFGLAIKATAEEHGIVAVVGMFTPADSVFRLPNGELSTDRPGYSG